MQNSDSTPVRQLRSELRKSENREKIAHYKLSRLKQRFDKLYDELVSAQERLSEQEIDFQDLQEQYQSIQAEQEKSSQEALMWRTQLFERMDRLDETNHQLSAAEKELELAWERADQATNIHQISTEELRRRDRERLAFQVRLDEMHRSHRDVLAQSDGLVEALADAQSVITELQRENDLYQRKLDGLKSLGASLTEKLRVSSSKRDEMGSDMQELCQQIKEEKQRRKDAEAEAHKLTQRVFELQQQLLSDQLPVQLSGTQQSPERSLSADKVLLTARPSILNKASKRVSGWFRAANPQSSERRHFLRTKIHRSDD